MRQAEPVEHIGDGREGLHLDAPLAQRRPDLFEGDAGLAQGKGPNRLGMRLQHRAAMPTDLGRRRRAGRTHALHQLDRRRGTDLEPMAAARAELPPSTARTIRSRRS